MLPESGLTHETGTWVTEIRTTEFCKEHLGHNIGFKFEFRNVQNCAYLRPEQLVSADFIFVLVAIGLLMSFAPGSNY